MASIRGRSLRMSVSHCSLAASSFALLLGAAACGATTETTTGALVSTSTQPSLTTSTTEPVTIDPSVDRLTLPTAAQTDSSAQSDPATRTSSSTASIAPAPPALSTATTAQATTTTARVAPTSTTAVAGANNFPDVSVVNLTDQATVSLASELGGGSIPILLWFWGPL